MRRKGKKERNGLTDLTLRRFDSEIYWEYQGFPWNIEGKGTENMGRVKVRRKSPKFGWSFSYGHSYGVFSNDDGIERLLHSLPQKVSLVQAQI
jgi:hypothetical protein